MPTSQGRLSVGTRAEIKGRFPAQLFLALHPVSDPWSRTSRTAYCLNAWFEYIHLAELPKNSIVVLDNTTFHKSKEFRNITETHNFNGTLTFRYPQIRFRTH